MRATALAPWDTTEYVPVSGRASVTVTQSHACKLVDSRHALCACHWVGPRLLSQQAVVSCGCDAADACKVQQTARLIVSPMLNDWPTLLQAISDLSLVLAANTEILVLISFLGDIPASEMPVMPSLTTPSSGTHCLQH